uniref:CTCK domain-containing protein n=1 Tax=Electrophorus electricus TaxID=8005 RepID=A0AAY5F2H8_ELEEL
MCIFRVIFLLIWLIIIERFGLAFADRLIREFKEFQSRRTAHETRTEGRNSTYQLIKISFGTNSKTSTLPVKPTYQPASRDAKLLWNHFMFRRKSEFQTIMSIRNNEVHQEKCRTLSFTQRVSHENCETLVLKNNVCFGKCHHAGAEADPASCHICSPRKSSRETVQLECGNNTRVTSIVTVVEDCACQIRKGWQSP